MFRRCAWTACLICLFGSTPAMAAKVMAVNAKASRVIAMVSPPEKKILTATDKVLCKFPSGEMVGTRVSWKKKRLVVLEFASTPKVKRGMRFKIVAAEGDSEVAADGSTIVPNDGSSLAVRSMKTAGAAVIVTPLSDWFLQFGGSAFFNLSPALTLGASVLTGNKNLTADFQSDDIDVTNVSVSSTAFWAWGKYFFGNSFNISGGLGLRQASAIMQFDDPNSDLYLDATIEMSSIVAPIAIGQEWAWDFGLTVGIDYLAYFVAISGEATVGTDTNGDDTDGELAQLRDESAVTFQELASSGHLTLALLTLGFQF